jgi:hypothetical protein
MINYHVQAKFAFVKIEKNPYIVISINSNAPLHDIISSPEPETTEHRLRQASPKLNATSLQIAKQVDKVHCHSDQDQRNEASMLISKVSKHSM